MSGFSLKDFQGTYYDGRSARAYPVTCRIEDGILHVQGDAIARSVPLPDITLSDALGSAPRKLSFPDGASVEAPNTPELIQALGDTRGAHSWVAHLEARWIYAVAALLASVAVIAAGYVWGLPLVSRQIAMQMPAGAIKSIGDQTLETLEKQYLEPSTVPQERQQRIAERLRHMQAADGPLPHHQLVFRSSPKLGANALALPNDSVILTDQLVKLAASDDELIAVIGHELGHLHDRHALRGLIQGSIVAIVVAWYAGDISSLAVGLPVLLLQTGYSRQFETEADAYGAAFLRANGLSPEILATMLEKLDAVHTTGAPNAYLSTHPQTKDRINALRGRI